MSSRYIPSDPKCRLLLSRNWCIVTLYFMFYIAKKCLSLYHCDIYFQNSYLMSYDRSIKLIQLYRCIHIHAHIPFFLDGESILLMAWAPGLWHPCIRSVIRWTAALVASTSTAGGDVASPALRSGTYTSMLWDFPSPVMALKCVLSDGGIDLGFTTMGSDRGWRNEGCVKRKMYS